MCGVKKYQKKISYNSQSYSFSNIGITRYRHDHIRNVAKEEIRINTTSENVVIVFLDLNVDANRRAVH
jgi:hypothetical protein